MTLPSLSCACSSPPGAANVLDSVNFPYWRRFSYELLDEKLGEQSYHCAGFVIVGLALWSKILKVFEDISVSITKGKDVGGASFLSSSLCVGDLDFRVTDS
ncbi:hypothetical protein EZV62_016272 [Acer yangbiense]|uniref:Uncharacterized protein n=1 Tax=Acer yangbiense TaxID=1000413 RepID=A0A5C7HN33_9ROSI|nr:hypothetical protein EZV62_016272 [Acer yangbiense]